MTRAEDPSQMNKNENWKLRALEFASEGIVITDALLPENPIVYVNEGFRKITGYSDKDVLGKNCRFMRGEHTATVTTEEIRKAIKEQISFSSEILNYRKNGEQFWNQLHISPVRDDSGKVTHFVGIQLDITRLKESERLLSQIRDQLVIAERFSAVGEMAAGVAHEINNPISVIYHKAKQALRFVQEHHTENFTSEDREKLIAALQAIEGMGMRVAKLVREMQTFTGAVARSTVERVLLESAFDAALLLHEKRVSELGLVVTRDFETKIEIAGDILQIEQIFSNLISNSLDAISSQHLRTLSVCARKSGESVLVYVVDSAPLLSDEIAAKVFMPFFTTKDVGKGTGLGLSIARSFAQQNGGDLSLEKNENSNVFILTLRAQT